MTWSDDYWNKYWLQRWIDGKWVEGRYIDGVWTPRYEASDDSGKGVAKERRNKARRARAMRNRFKNPYGAAPYRKWDYKTRQTYWAGGVWDKKAKRWKTAAKNWEPTAPLYFAYGSNLNVKQMAQRAPEAKFFGAMRMPNWKLVFRGVADIEADPGNHVEGGLWRITGADEMALDGYEGVKSGFYVKDYFTVSYTNAAGEPVVERCLVYLMNRDRGQSSPSKAYLESIRQGYEDFGLDHGKLNEAAQSADAVEEAERQARAEAAAAAYENWRAKRSLWPKSYYDGPQGEDYDDYFDPDGAPYGRYFP